jgi:hypothetical protein
MDGCGWLKPVPDKTMSLRHVEPLLCRMVALNDYIRELGRI